MAVENKFVDANLAADKKGNPALVSHGAAFELAFTFEVAAADDDGSVFKIARIAANLILQKVEIYNDAIAGGSDYDLGFLEENGDSISPDKKNVLADALDMSSASGQSAPKDGMKDVAIADVSKKLYELLGKTVAPNTKSEGYILALTANTVGAGGTISGRARFIQG